MMPLSPRKMKGGLVATTVFVWFLVSSAAGACPEIVTRAGWGARATRSSGNMRLPVSHVFIHHTAGAKCNSKDTCARVARQTQNHHMDANRTMPLSPPVEHRLKGGLFVTAVFIWFLVSSATGVCPEIVPRAGWGARATRSSGSMRLPVHHVFIHHTGGERCNNKVTCARVARRIQNHHMDVSKKADIGYSFLVGGDGRIYEGRGWARVGAHTYNYNSVALGISFMGNFDKELPDSAMLDAAKNLIQCGVQKKFITKDHQIHGHRDAKCTACPGAALYRNMQRWDGFKGGRLPGYTC